MVPERIVALGAGRMGRGIAVAFAYSGHEVTLLDVKARDAAGFAALAQAARKELETTFGALAELGLAEAADVGRMARRVQVRPLAAAEDVLAGADVVFEGVPEVVEVKREALALASRLAPASAILASTTSTILADALQEFVTGPERFLNAHWLNPAYLVPLVEVSPGAGTDPGVTDRLCGLLERIGKVPVRCQPSPGYIVPRIQALAMNEAARLVEEGVASAEDIDLATRYGFGFRFAVLGLLEFIDWGGGDILYHASRYLASETGESRFLPPAIVERNMAEKRRGLQDGAGFHEYRGLDVDGYRKERMAAFAALLRLLGKPPVKG